MNELWKCQKIPYLVRSVLFSNACYLKAVDDIPSICISADRELNSLLRAINKV
jgi:hypothetical protein